MLKYANVQVVFQEFPGETTLAINLTRCPHHCPGCHSPHLWKDEGMELTTEELTRLLEPYKKPGMVTCVGLMGGDADFTELADVADWIHTGYPHLKVGWYSGNNTWNDTQMDHFDYCKFGSYRQDLGPLNNPTTNQVMYKKVPVAGMWVNITPVFWPDTPNIIKKIFKLDIDKQIRFIYNITKNTSIGCMIGVRTDGTETRLEIPPLEDYAKGVCMDLNRQECPLEYRVRPMIRRPGGDWELDKESLPDYKADFQDCC